MFFKRNGFPFDGALHPFRIVGLLTSLSVLLTATALAKEVPGFSADLFTKDFLRSHCFECHEGSQPSGNLDLTKLSHDLSERKTFDSWVRIFDRVEQGEMPPKDHETLLPQDSQRFLSQCEKWLVQFESQQRVEGGRVQGRRLTNLQLERTLQDLLAIDIPLARAMPDEPRTALFTTLAHGQAMSHYQLDQQLDVVDQALDEAFRRAAEPEDRWQQEFSAAKLARAPKDKRNREPEYIDGRAVVWSSRLIFYGRMPATTVQESGWYRFNLVVSSLKTPQQHGVWCSVRSGLCVSSAPLLDWIGSFEATDEPKEVTFEAWIPAGHMLEIRPHDNTLKAAKFAGGQAANGEGGSQDVPGIAIERMRMERIHRNGEASATRERLFGSYSLKPVGSSFELSAGNKQPEEILHQLLTDFAAKAFRRPVTKEDVAPFVRLASEVYDVERSLVAAIRSGYRAILSSPRFLYFHEQSGALDGHAVANRLSYFLWNSPPDAELLRLAEKDQLKNPEILQQQVERMLADARGKSFIQDFAAQWLDLRDIDFTEPDARQFPDFDAVVQNSMLDETHTFLQTLLDENLPVTQLVSADFTFLNSRLARYYRMKPVAGDRLQKVTLVDQDQRRGLLTQGAILKVTANGTTTSPVVRGVWVCERILGERIPPPPSGVPAIEPDVRGVKTIREQLEKHRSDVNCASCHRLIDPPGFALENFDPAGRWREVYPIGNSGKKKDGIKIDSGYTLADGRKFRDFDEIRQLMEKKPEPIARNLAEKLLAYGTGAEISFADRVEVNRITENTRGQGYGLRSLIKSVVVSPVFLTK